MAEGPVEAFYSSILNAFQANKRMADRAVAQVEDSKLRQPLDQNSNSIAVIMKHITGNLISRWTDCLTTDGEKPDRNRDNEFVDSFASTEELLAYWEKGWSVLFDQLDKLTNEDPERIIYIRGEPHTLALALSRSLGHTCFHIGQVVQLARFYAGENWQTLTIPRGKSEEFNRKHWGEKGNSHS